jgi:hypothetical protein
MLIGLQLRSVVRLVLLWAFSFWTAGDPARMEAGWVAMPTREACEASREYLREMVAIHGGAVAAVSGCRHMTVEELRQKRHEPPPDTPNLVPGF